MLSHAGTAQFSFVCIISALNLIDGCAKGIYEVVSISWFTGPVDDSLRARLLFGDSGTSTIRGTITDSSGAALPGATVTITNLQTNLSRTLTTGSPPELTPLNPSCPGEYKVEIEAKGFRKSVAARVQALVGSIAEVSQSLKVGEVEERCWWRLPPATSRSTRRTRPGKQYREPGDP